MMYEVMSVYVMLVR